MSCDPDSQIDRVGRRERACCLGRLPWYRAIKVTKASFGAARSRAETVTVKPLVKLVVLAAIIIASNAGAHAQTAAPATAIPPGTTQGPWTSVKPGNSGSYCSPGEYAVGIEVEVAPSGTAPCAECISRLRVICRRYGI